jgi:hypothetical protein
MPPEMAALVQLYTRKRCCLCEDVKAVLARVRTDMPFDLEEIDVDDDGALRERFGLEVPVVFVAGRKAFKYRVDETALRQRLARARQGEP